MPSKPGVRKKWTIDEDERLHELQLKYGQHGNWHTISLELNTGRSAKQCRERWRNIVDPSIKKTKWTAEEDRRIIQLRGTLGNQWVKIASHFENRGENAVKNRFYSLSRRGKIVDGVLVEDRSRIQAKAPGKQTARGRKRSIKRESRASDGKPDKKRGRRDGEYSGECSGDEACDPAAAAAVAAAQAAAIMTSITMPENLLRQRTGTRVQRLPTAALKRSPGTRARKASMPSHTQLSRQRQALADDAVQDSRGKQGQHAPPPRARTARFQQRWQRHGGKVVMQQQQARLGSGRSSRVTTDESGSSGPSNPHPFGAPLVLAQSHAGSPSGSSSSQLLEGSSSSQLVDYAWSRQATMQRRIPRGTMPPKSSLQRVARRNSGSIPQGSAVVVDDDDLEVGPQQVQASQTVGAGFGGAIHPLLARRGGTGESGLSVRIPRDSRHDVCLAAQQDMVSSVRSRVKSKTAAVSQPALAPESPIEMDSSGSHRDSIAAAPLETGALEPDSRVRLATDVQGSSASASMGRNSRLTFHDVLYQQVRSLGQRSGPPHQWREFAQASAKGSRASDALGGGQDAVHPRGSHAPDAALRTVGALRGRVVESMQSEASSGLGEAIRALDSSISSGSRAGSAIFGERGSRADSAMSSSDAGYPSSSPVAVPSVPVASRLSRGSSTRHLTHRNASHGSARRRYSSGAWGSREVPLPDRRKDRRASTESYAQTWSQVSAKLQRRGEASVQLQLRQQLQHPTQQHLQQPTPSLGKTAEYSPRAQSRSRGGRIMQSPGIIPPPIISHPHAGDRGLLAASSISYGGHRRPISSTLLPGAPTAMETALGNPEVRDRGLVSMPPPAATSSSVSSDGPARQTVNALAVLGGGAGLRVDTSPPDPPASISSWQGKFPDGSAQQDVRMRRSSVQAAHQVAISPSAGAPAQLRALGWHGGRLQRMHVGRPSSRHSSARTSIPDAALGYRTSSSPQQLAMAGAAMPKEFGEGSGTGSGSGGDCSEGPLWWLGGSSQAYLDHVDARDGRNVEQSQDTRHLNRDDSAAKYRADVTWAQPMTSDTDAYAVGSRLPSWTPASRGFSRSSRQSDASVRASSPLARIRLLSRHEMRDQGLAPQMERRQPYESSTRARTGDIGVETRVGYNMPLERATNIDISRGGPTFGIRHPEGPETSMSRRPTRVADETASDYLGAGSDSSRPRQASIQMDVDSGLH